jgi:site-specific DNA-cytosine methylase
MSHRTAAILRFFSEPELEVQLRALYADSRNVHVLAGGPPCQGFSRWGRAAIGYLRRVGLHSYSDDHFGDERNRLFRNYVAFLAALAPDAFLFENVNTFNSAVLVEGHDVLRAGEALESAVAELSKGGLCYRTAATLLNANTLGVPQNRERFVMVGLRATDAGANPARSVLDGLPPLTPVPLSAALAGLQVEPAYARVSECSVRSRIGEGGAPRSARGPALAYGSWIRLSPEGRRVTYTDAHIVRQPSADDARFFQGLEPGTAWQDIPVPELKARLRAINPKHHFLKKGYFAKHAGRHGDWLARLDAGKPCRAICAHLAKDGYAYVHPTEPRTLSVREAARVQSFPDWFSFAGRSLISAYALVGNAVPPLLAAHLARALAAVLSVTNADGPLKRRKDPSRRAA